MVYTELAPRQQQFHVAPGMAQPKSAVTTSVVIQNALWKATVTQSRIRLERRCRDDSAAVAIVKRLGLISR